MLRDRYILPSGLAMPAMGLGTANLRGEEGLMAIEIALVLGYRHIDTADSYGNHDIVGRAIKGYERSELFITTKVPEDRLHYDEVIDACRANLRELDTDYIDLYLIHWPNPDVPMQQTFDALAQLKELGMIRDAGVSNFQRRRLRRALEITPIPIANNQVELHPFLYQDKLIDFCHEHHVTVTAYSPLARGKVFDDPTLRMIAADHGKTPAQVSLRWLLQKGCIVIPRSSDEQHLRENLDVFDWSLSATEVEAIDNIPEELRIANPADFDEFDEQ